MLSRFTRYCLEHRRGVLFWSAILLALGIRAGLQLAIDVYPDLAPTQVLVISTAPGRSAEELERQVTIPIELAMSNVPDVTAIRSRTIYGLSVVEIIFEEDTDKFFARQRVEEQLPAVELPEGVEPQLGPLASAYGEIYRYELQSDGTHDLMSLQTLNRWVVSPRLERVAGVTEVVNFGGLQGQFTLKLNPRSLERYRFTLSDVIEAVRTNNANAGGSVLRRGDMGFDIHGQGALTDKHSLESTVVDTIDGAPVYVRDVADVEFDARLPMGIFGNDERRASLEGIVMMTRDDNPSQTLEAIHAEVDKLNAGTLPEGVRIVPFYDRQELVERVRRTVGYTILCGLVLALLMLVVFLGNPLLALLVALTIPVGFLFALVPVQSAGVTVRLLSIGAIDFGILIWGAVIMVDQAVLRMTNSPLRAIDTPLHSVQLHQAVTVSTDSVDNSVLASMLIVAGCHLPLLMQTGVEGLIFRPMAWTAMLSLLGAVVYTLFVLPTLVAWTLRRGYCDWSNPVLVVGRDLYAGLIRLLLAWRRLVVVAGCAAATFAIAWSFPRLGGEFLPPLDEGVIWIRATFPEGIALDQTAEFADRIRAVVREYPGVAFAASQAGRNDSGTDPFPSNRLEVLVGFKTSSAVTVKEQLELRSQLGSRLRDEFPTARFNFTQPIIDGISEDTNGTSADVALELSGMDLAKLRNVGERAAAILRTIRGAIDVHIEQDGPLSQLTIVPDRVRCAQYDIHIDSVRQLISTTLGGEPIGVLYDAERRFEIVARFDRGSITSPEAIGELPVFTRSGAPIPLSQVADFVFKDVPTIIAREEGRRKITVRCDVVGRDQESFVDEARIRVERGLEYPEGCQGRWIGLFENVARIRRWFLGAMLLNIAGIYGVLILAFHSHRRAAVIASSVPASVAAGSLALWWLGMPINVATAVGFVLMTGMSVIGGVMLVQGIDHSRCHSLPLDDAIREGVLGRLRAILMASLGAILGLTPAAIVQGPGTDIQRPLAIVIVAGLSASLVWTLLVVPALYSLLGESEAAEEPRAGVEGQPHAHPLKPL